MVIMVSAKNKQQQQKQSDQQAVNQGNQSIQIKIRLNLHILITYKVRWPTSKSLNWLQLLLCNSWFLAGRPP